METLIGIFHGLSPLHRQAGSFVSIISACFRFRDTLLSYNGNTDQFLKRIPAMYGIQKTLIVHQG